MPKPKNRFAEVVYEFVPKVELAHVQACRQLDDKITDLVVERKLDFLRAVAVQLICDARDGDDILRAIYYLNRHIEELANDAQNTDSCS